MQLSTLRNFGIIAHIDAGKTTTTENLLRYAHVIHAIGTVDEGTTTTDDYILEQRKGITIFSAAVTCAWRGHTLNLIDTPGHVDFTAEVERCLRVVDGAVVVLDATAGVEAQTETVWRQARHYAVPCLCFLNKMDSIGASLARSLESIRTRLGGQPVVVTMPAGVESELQGVIDVLRLKLLRFDPATVGEQVTESDVPPEYREAAEQHRLHAVEVAAEFDEAVMEHYLGNRPVPVEDLRRGLRRGTLAGQIQPTFAAAAKLHIGVQPMMDGIVEYLGSPLDRPVIEGRGPSGQTVRRDLRTDTHTCALAFKTATDQHDELTFLRIYTGSVRTGDTLINPRTGRRERASRLYRMFANHRRLPLAAAEAGDIVAVAGLKSTVTGDTLCDPDAPIVLEQMQFPEPVVQVAIEPKSSADKDKLAAVLKVLAKDDPTFQVSRDAETGQTMLQCMGELHAEVILFRITNDFKVAAKLREPRVAYKEMPQVPAEGEATHEVKLANKTIFGHVRVRVTPSKHQIAPRLTEELLDEASRKTLQRFLPAIRDGFLSELAQGPVASQPVIYAEVALLGGTVSPESADAAYSAAAVRALREALSRSQAVVVEPQMKFEVTSPAESVGNMVSDLRRRGAEITDLRSIDGDRKILSGIVPLAKMFGYATAMRSLTSGRGAYTLEPFDYRPVAEMPAS